MHSSLQHTKTKNRIPAAAYEKNRFSGFIEHLDTLQDVSVTLPVMFKNRLDKINDMHKTTLRENISEKKPW